MEYDPGRMQFAAGSPDRTGAAPRNDFIFTEIRENSGLGKGLFEFQAPADVETIGLP